MALLRRALYPLLISTLALLGGCEVSERIRCSEPIRTGTLPTTLREASGLVISRSYPGVLWTHEDSGNPPALIALDSAGNILGQARVQGAENVDWEDIALGPCPGGSCIYIADTGDNRLARSGAVIYRVPEPAPGDSLTQMAEAFPIHFPDGARDVEALYLLPDSTPYLISKGRRYPVELFRYPPPLRAGQEVTVEEIQRFTREGVPLPDQVTGADATADGSWVAVRSYSWVQLYHPTTDGRLEPSMPSPGISLHSIAEPQGEGVAVRDDGVIFFISEAGPPGVPGVIGRIECRFERG